MTCEYGDYQIECLEIGKGLWHARIRRADLKPVMLDGVLLPTLEMGFAWSSPDAAIADARTQIDKFTRRYPNARHEPQAELAQSH
jgi:hypothetical protein